MVQRRVCEELEVSDRNFRSHKRSVPVVSDYLRRKRGLCDVNWEKKRRTAICENDHVHNPTTNT